MPKLHFKKQSTRLRNLRRAKLKGIKLAMMWHATHEIKDPYENPFHFQGHHIPRNLGVC
jgi:hypothetical protein